MAPGIGDCGDYSAWRDISPSGTPNIGRGLPSMPMSAGAGSTNADDVSRRRGDSPRQRRL